MTQRSRTYPLLDDCLEDDRELICYARTRRAKVQIIQSDRTDNELQAAIKVTCCLIIGICVVVTISILARR